MFTTIHVRPFRQGSASGKIWFPGSLPGKPTPPNPGFSDSVPQKVLCRCSQEFSDCCCVLPPLQAALRRSLLRRAPDQAHGVSASAHSRAQLGVRARRCLQPRQCSLRPSPTLGWSHANARSVHLQPASCSTSAPHAGTHEAQQTRLCNRPESRLEGDRCSRDAAVHDDLRRGTQGTPSQDTALQRTTAYIPRERQKVTIAGPTQLTRESSVAPQDRACSRRTAWRSRSCRSG